jgi:HK97 family phage major capsid protein
MNMSLIELREEQIEAHVAFQAARDAIKEAGEDADLDTLEAAFGEAEERYNTAKSSLATAEDRERKARQKFELERRAMDADKRLDAPASTPRVSVGREPLTYQRNGAHSLFTDLFHVTANPGIHADATQRLARHQKEMAFERGVKNGAIPQDAQFDLSSTDAAGGYLVAPLYLQEEFVTLARAGRVVADTLGPRPLPANTDSINLPTHEHRHSTVATQADNGAVSETDAAFGTVAGDVKTVAGLQDVSQQLVDRGVPGIDEVIFADLAKALRRQPRHRRHQLGHGQQPRPAAGVGHQRGHVHVGYPDGAGAVQQAGRRHPPDPRGHLHAPVGDLHAPPQVGMDSRRGSTRRTVR